jgi:hypothetical protein
MHGDINLLDFDARDLKAYVSLLIKKLYSPDELARSYVIDGKSTSKKQALDLERLKKIRGMSTKNEFYSSVHFKVFFLRCCID